MSRAAIISNGATKEAADQRPHQEQKDMTERCQALRRQPTRYPHGLSISVQTVVEGENGQVGSYSRESTLRCSWEGAARGPDHCQLRSFDPNAIGHPESSVKSLQQHPRHGTNGAAQPPGGRPCGRKPHLLALEYVRSCCQWRLLRWPLMGAIAVLLCCGLIAYCLWLHDVSVARARHLHARQRWEESEEIEEAITSTGPADLEPESEGPTTEQSDRPHKSTVLTAISTRSHSRPQEERRTTVAWRESSRGREDGAQETTTLMSGEMVPGPVHGAPFTSGHQNSFGVPLEEDERILRLLNGLFPSRHQPVATTVDSLAKVSPTIPPLSHSPPTAATSSARPLVQENGCYSTSLPMCRGVLDYDLTHNAMTAPNATETQAYEALVHSNCSARAAEFVCALLEPECRPLHIGVLAPCRRICKVVREACSVVIANSDLLTAAFDCGLYPDSDDPHQCEDPTRRRGYCFDNEFECYDRSCIPSQWQCDNIKDCAVGEDEDGCLVCEQQDEFRCRSNEKCVAGEQRCDMKFDCFDGSDEEDCSDYAIPDEEARFDEADLNAFPRVFSYASFLLPNQSDERTELYSYIAASSDGESVTSDLPPEAARDLHVTNRTSGVSQEEVLNSVPEEGPQGFAQFRDSKEIMMTSDSENKLKYSASIPNGTSIPDGSADSSAPLKPAASRLHVVTSKPRTEALSASCAAHQLRCVSGKCITVEQLCDKKTDCPDGADELRCVYKERSRTSTSTPTTSATIPTTTTKTLTRTTSPSSRSSSSSSSGTTTARTIRRSMRTTIRRKVKA